MKHSTPPPTKAQAARMAEIKRGWCLACAVRRCFTFSPEIHHLLSGGKRMGHDYTVGLCSWHHRGDTRGTTHPLGGNMDEATAVYLLGPSMAKEPAKFEEEFGTQWALLERQNELLGLPPPAPFDRKAMRKPAKRSSKIITHPGTL